MIVLKIQRLRARERTLGRAALEEATASIAAEQRAVRANFIFLMGGHVEDEEEEAERSSEIAEGRLQSSARKEINAAIDYMSRAEQALDGRRTPAPRCRPRARRSRRCSAPSAAPATSCGACRCAAGSIRRGG